MQILFRILILLFTVCNIYSQEQDFIPVKPVRSYQIKNENYKGKTLYLYNNDNNTPLSGKHKITLFFLDTSKSNGNGIERITLLNDTKYSNYSRLNGNLIGKFSKGYKTGLWKMTYKKKLVKTENWNQGLIYGKYRFYDIEGNLLYKTTFGTSGNGVYKDFYFETGILKQEGNYNNGKKQGEWCDYDVQGKLKQTTHFKNGIPITE